MILLFGGDHSSGLSTGILTESVRLDDIGQGQTQLTGPILVQDILQVERVQQGDLTTGTLTEHVRADDDTEDSLVVLIDPGDLVAALLEHVRLDDIGQGIAQLLGAIRVRDVLTVTRVDASDLFTGVLLEHVKVSDANDSWAELSKDEFLLVQDVLTVQRSGVGSVLSVILAEHVLVRDVYESPDQPLTVGIQIGFHPSSFRDTLIDVLNCVAVWPLADGTGDPVHDIIGGHHGAVVGAGIVVGEPNGLPEGGLGFVFDGNQHIAVPDDSADTAQLNMSLADGDVDIVFMIKTTTNDATNRAIVHKMVTDATGNGWSVSLVNGAIRWREEIAGVQQFSFDRGSVADGQWHVVHCCKQTTVGTGEAFIEIDGVQVGATQLSAPLELDVTAADLMIGKWADGSGAFIGALSYVMIGREGDDGLGAALELCRPWTDVTEDSRSAMGMTISYGIQGTRPLDNVAHTGTCLVGLDNSQANSAELLGYYSLDHVNKRANFRKGAPLRVVFSYQGISYYKHVGRIVSALPSPGQKLDRLTRVTSADWMDVAASSRLRVPAQTDIDSHDAIGLLIGEALRPPHALVIHPGSETFGYALHMGVGGRETIMSEAARICTSEFGRFYVRGDQSQGGVVVFEGRPYQQTETTALATFSNTMSGLTPNDGQKPNLLMVTVHPVEVDDTPPDVVFAMTARQPIPPGETVQILVDYRDPLNAALRVAADDIITPAIVTDYTMTTGEDGSGINLDAYVSIAETGAELGGTNAVLTVTNESGSTGWFMAQIRGTVIRHEDPITIPVGDGARIRADGPAEETLDLAYISSRGFAQDLGEHVLALYEAGKVASISFIANASDELLTQALEREPGDRIDIVEEMQSGNVAHSYIINHVELQVSNRIIIRCTWRLGPVADVGQVWLMGVVGSSEMGVTTVLGL